jgi:predicted enzyme related to lactoylglutathione lyase
MERISMRALVGLVVSIFVGVLWGCSTVGEPDLSGMSFSDEPLVGKFVWYDLITDDADAARRFYGGLFGWTFEKTTGPGGSDYLVARDGGVYVAGIVTRADPSEGAEFSRWLPYVSVADVDESADRARAAGGRVAVAPLDVRLGRVAAIVDPEGAVLGLARSDVGDPDDATTAGAPGRVLWTELLADDDAAAASFYATVVGYEAATIERRGGDYTLLRFGGVQRAGVLQNPTDWEPQWLTYFGVEDPAAAAKLATELGGRVLLEPTPEVREGTMALVIDPSGAVLALQKSTS